MMLLSTIPVYKSPEKDEDKPKAEGMQEVGTIDDFFKLNIQ